MVSRQKVLVADDDDAIQICMEDISQQEGWDVFFARDGEECLDRIQALDPSLVILDLRMPRMTGEEVLAKLEEAGRRVPVLLISAEKDLSRMKRFSAIVRTLTKPFDLEEFVGAVNEELRQQRQAREDAIPNSSVS